MDFKEFEYVLKIAELRNMTKAAAELYVSQPSLSHYIARVEAEFGTPIFDRSTNPISLTPAGEKYVETAMMILDLDMRLQHEVTEITDFKKGVIRLGISHARASYFLPYVLPAFWELYPGIDLATTETNADMIADAVIKGHCDFGIVPLLEMEKYGLEYEAVCSEELFLISGNPLDHACGTDDHRFIELGEMDGQSFCLLKKGHGIRKAADIIFMEHHVRPKHIFETTSNETAFRLATVGMGLSIVPESTIILAHPVRKPYIYSLTEQGFCWKIGAIYRKKEMLAKAQRDFIDIMEREFSGGLMHE